MPQRTVEWGRMRRGEIGESRRQGAVVIVPIGAIEQHGPHLPLNTDTINAAYVARLAAESITEFPVLVAPPVWWGFSPHHMPFPGTITLGVETIRLLVRDICHSVHRHGFEKIILLNAHGTNIGLLTAVAGELTAEGIDTAVVTYYELVPDVRRDLCDVDKAIMTHAGEMETSIQLFLQADSVDLTQSGAALEASRPAPGKRRRALGVYQPNVWEIEAPSGVTGDPRPAAAEKGERFLTASAEALVAFIREYSRS